MNRAKVIALCHKVAENTGLSFNTVLLYYFLENLLKRLAAGENKGRFIFKGGFLLSNVVGVQTRSTVDIDFLIRNLEMSPESIEQVLTPALEEESGDLAYEIQDIVPIREADQYGGYRVRIACRLGNTRQILPLDIATGDPVTPSPVEYIFTSIFSDESIPIEAYPLETIIAEKLQTIYSRGFFNSRSKDYYDLHILYNSQRHHINEAILKEACRRTFRYRNTEFNLEKLRSLLESIKDDQSFLDRWRAYARKNNYVGEITFADVINSAIQLVDGASNVK